MEMDPAHAPHTGFLQGAQVPNWADDSVWPSSVSRILVMVGFTIAIAIHSNLVTRRMPYTLARLRTTSFARLIAGIVLLLSFFFSITAPVILFGVGTSYSQASCNSVIFLCLVLYAASKVGIYVFLLERMFLVHCKKVTGGPKSRFTSKWFVAGFIGVIGWIAVFFLWMFFPNHAIRDHDGQCQVGLRIQASAPALAVDLALNLYLTAGFVYPIWRSKFPEARSLAWNSVIMAGASMLSVTANVLTMILLKGHQAGWLCFAICITDLTVNALILFSVTSGESVREQERRAELNKSTGSVLPIQKRGPRLAEDLYYLHASSVKDEEEERRRVSYKPKPRTEAPLGRRPRKDELQLDGITDDEDDYSIASGGMEKSDLPPFGSTTDLVTNFPVRSIRRDSDEPAEKMC